MNSVKIKEQTVKEVYETYGVYYSKLNGVATEKLAKDVLSVDKISEQVKIIERFLGESIEGKKILEIGSGYGLFVAVGVLDLKADVYGVEPSAVGFGGSFETSQEILKSNSIDIARIKCGVAEELPFDDNSFEIVYSTNVFEHVNNPEKAFHEAIRVCKPGGLIQIVIPNYGSFYEGHYACWYIPYTPKKLWKFWLKYGLKKDPSYADTLRTNLNYFTIRKIVKPFILEKQVEILSYGEEIFLERMNTGNFVPYAGLTKVQKILIFLKKAKLVWIVSKLLLSIKAHSPLIISIRKLNT